MIGDFSVGGGGAFEGRKNSDRPDSFRSSTVGIVMPPGGPKVADFKEDSMCGDDVECFSARRCRIGACNMGATDGELGTSMLRVTKPVVLVLRLSWLGFLFIPGMTGLMNEGDAGSEGFARELKGGCMESPFMFFARLGAGDVVGLSRFFVSDTFKVAIDDKPPKDVALQLSDESGWRLTGESGDEEGDGSEREDESVIDAVVVGEEPADSEFWVDVLS